MDDIEKLYDQQKVNAMISDFMTMAQGREATLLETYKALEAMQSTVLAKMVENVADTKAKFLEIKERLG